MTRKAVVDRDTILNMLREGKTTQNIAEKYGVSRQAIDLHRRDYIKKGLLPNSVRGGYKESAGKQFLP